MTSSGTPSRSSGRPSLLYQWFPYLDRNDRRSMVERFERDAHWNTDFVVMMGLSSALASMGLLQDSTAVVIGAMLVAPLMSPLLGGGFALVQGNLTLFRNSLRAMGYGVCMALAISLTIGYLTPSDSVTSEIQARGSVDLLDLGVALASGMAAAYALARPNVAAVMSGVAIAAALVPPLTVIGLAFSDGAFAISLYAAILFLINLIAIVLGAALIFRLLGVHESAAREGAPLWARKMVKWLVVASAVLFLPLADRTYRQARIGQSRTLVYPLSAPIREEVRAFVEGSDALEVVLMGRSGVEPESGPQIYLASSGPVPPQTEADLANAIQQRLGTTKVPVRVLILQTAERMVPHDTPPVEPAKGF